MRFMPNKIEAFMDAFDEGLKKGDLKIDLEGPKIGKKFAELDEAITLENPVKLKNPIKLNNIIKF